MKSLDSTFISEVGADSAGKKSRESTGISESGGASDVVRPVGVSRSLRGVSGVVSAALSFEAAGGGFGDSLTAVTVPRRPGDSATSLPDPLGSGGAFDVAGEGGFGAGLGGRPPGAGALGTGGGPAGFAATGGAAGDGAFGATLGTGGDALGSDFASGLRTGGDALGSDFASGLGSPPSSGRSFTGEVGSSLLDSTFVVAGLASPFGFWTWISALQRRQVTTTP
jgi:hypothetical protein